MEKDEAPKTIEDGGKATVDELINELNLGNQEEPRPIYVSAFLTQQDEQKYSELHFDYKDIFACNYKEMPGFDPKVDVHRLAITKGVSPKKQSQ